MKPGSTIPAALALLLNSAALLQAAEPPESNRSFLLRSQVEATDPIIEYCVSQVPSLKTALEAAYADYKSKLLAVAAPLAEQLLGSEELSKPVDPNFVAEFGKVREQMLAQIKTVDAKAFCTPLPAKLASVDVAAFRASVEDAYNRFTNAAREKAKPPQ